MKMRRVYIIGLRTKHPKVDLVGANNKKNLALFKLFTSNYGADTHTLGNPATAKWSGYGGLWGRARSLREDARGLQGTGRRNPLPAEVELVAAVKEV